MNDLQGKVALVTGSARGLGASICRSLSEAGVRVVAADMNEAENRELIRDIEQRGGQAADIRLDVGDESQVQEAVRNTLERLGRLDILINNAGTDKTLSIEELSVADWDCVLRTNLRGPFLLSRQVLPVMKRQGGGHIVNIVSTAAKRAWANAAAYHASKWGFLGFSHALHVEARPHKIKVTAVIAGGMRTPFLLERFPDLDPGLLQDPAHVAETVRFVLTQPDETVIPEIMVIPMRETSWP
jgi:NAD(P)-dependent dehydrogenase (short-subunit alcohol dehydrogenase family)